MAIPHHHWTVYTRSKGHTAIGIAAYNARIPTWDSRYTPYHDYSNKSDLVWSGILTPESAPDWARDRRALWSAVEEREDQHHYRHRAQLCRGTVVAFQRELTMEQNILTLLNYLDDQYVAHGMIVDVNVHDAEAGDGGRNWHAHLLATMREVGPDGFGRKRRDWNGVDFGIRGGKKHHRPWALKDGPLRQRKAAWADYVNRALAASGSDVRIDHRSLKAQGASRLPQPKLGKATHAQGDWAKAKRDQLAEVIAHNQAMEAARRLSRPRPALLLPSGGSAPSISRGQGYGR